MSQALNPNPPSETAPLPKNSANFWKLLGGVAISDLGDGFTAITILWLATQLTNDAFLLSLITTILRLPWLLFSLPVGVVLDRVSRKQLMVGVSSARIITVAGLALAIFLNFASLPLLLVVAFVLGCLDVGFDSTAQTLVPALVEREQLERANGQLSTAQLITNDIVGRPIGGLLIGFGFFLPLLMDAGTAFIALLLLINLRGDFRVINPATPQNFWSDTAEGFKLVWHQPTLRLLAVLSIGVTIPYAAVLASQVFFVQEVVKLDATGYGLLLSVAVVGSVLGSQYVAQIKKVFGVRKTLIGSLAGIGLCLGAVGFSSAWLVVGSLYFVTAFFVVISSITRLSLLQLLTPTHLLGTVGGVFRFLSWGMSSVGMLAGGLVVDWATGPFGRDFALHLPYLILAVIYAGLIVIMLLWLKVEQLPE